MKKQKINKKKITSPTKKNAVINKADKKIVKDKLKKGKTSAKKNAKTQGSKKT